MSSQPIADTDQRLALEIKGISKAFGRFPALSDVSLQARDKEFLALLGPSGSGKTTLLRVLAGLETPDAGEVRFDGEDFLSLPVRKRRVGMVFQHYALFRHMTVAQNIAFGLAVRPGRERPSKSERADRVQNLLKLVQLEDLGKRFPSQLSGGQRQRVALARALAIEPRMLLLDEPFGALDAQVRRELRRWLRELHDRAGVTTVFVTHDQEEALDLADRVAILKDGQLVQLGKPNEVYDNPASPFIFDFLGAACRLDGEVRKGEFHAGRWRTPAPASAAEGAASVLFRPDDVVLEAPGGEGVQVTIREVSQRGPEVRVVAAAEGEVYELRIHGSQAPAFIRVGEGATLKPQRFQIYPA